MLVLFMIFFILLFIVLMICFIVMCIEIFFVYDVGNSGNFFLNRLVDFWKEGVVFKCFMNYCLI